MSCQARSGARTWLAPEVLQTSAMDCGPAALQCLLTGHRIGISYGRLREACQTGVDGTSIDRLEELACELGLPAAQMIIPVDHLQREPARLPAIAVTVAPSGVSHFVVLWRRVGRYVQVMDPARGRRVLQLRDLQRELYDKPVVVDGASFREHAGSEAFLTPLCARLRELTTAQTTEQLMAAALSDTSSVSLCLLDAVARAVAHLVEVGALGGRHQRSEVLVAWFKEHQSGDPEALPIPAPYWYATPSPDGSSVALRGALILSAARNPDQPQRAQLDLPSATSGLTPELRNALKHKEPGGNLQLWRVLSQTGRLRVIALGLLCAGITVTGLVEAVLMRAQLELPRYLGSAAQRSAAALSLLVFVAVTSALELLLQAAALRLGRHIDAKLRWAFFDKLPRLHDRYLQTRSSADMADRAHTAHLVRTLPSYLVSLLHAATELLATGVGLIWLDPGSAGRVALAWLASLAIPMLSLRALRERDARLRNHVASLARSYFDALRGSQALHAHQGARNLEAEHEGQLSDWKRAGRALARLSASLEAIVTALTLGLSAWLFTRYVSREREPLGALLYFYWAMLLPTYGRQVAQQLRQLPGFGNVITRLLDPLGAPEAPRRQRSTEPTRRPVSLALRDVSVHVGGHPIFEAASLTIQPGEHVAIVGLSGAGKSTLLGLALGWHRPSAGVVLWDDRELDEQLLPELRAQTVWVDPGVRLWNRSLLDNLRYASRDDNGDLLGAIREAELDALLGSLPEGLQTSVGDGGCRLSGGEGQRLRFARGLLAPAPQLVLLDEPFRGLDRTQRARLLTLARRKWRQATLLCVTHDIAETLDFARVLVVHAGRIVEDGRPRELALRRDCHYADMLQRERSLRDQLAKSASFRHWRIEHGDLVEQVAHRAHSQTIELTPSASASPHSEEALP